MRFNLKNYLSFSDTQYTFSGKGEVKFGTNVACDQQKFNLWFTYDLKTAGISNVVTDPKNVKIDTQQLNNIAFLCAAEKSDALTQFAPDQQDPFATRKDKVIEDYEKNRMEAKARAVLENYEKTGVKIDVDLRTSTIKSIASAKGGLFARKISEESKDWIKYLYEGVIMGNASAPPRPNTLPGETLLKIMQKEGIDTTSQAAPAPTNRST